MVGVDGEAPDAGPGTGGHRPPGQRAVEKRDERLWKPVGQWSQAGSEPRAENECLSHRDAVPS
jgi:hypothetical protein